MTRRHLLAAAVSFAASRINPSERSFWVLKLLQPTSLIVYPLGTARLHCTTPQEQWIVEGSQSLSLIPASAPIGITGPAGQPVNCLLEIPGVIRRRYLGTFQILSNKGMIIPVLTMNCETAAGSIVQAELPTSAALPQALAAQAVVSRSILCGDTKPKHQFADFCDTTHCQFLRSSALAGSKTADAINATRGRVLLDQGRILPALYSAACGGTTVAAITADHQYVSVPCEICRAQRLPRRGHGFGLCQEGAIGLANLGWTWPAVLAKYYPNTSIS